MSAVLCLVLPLVLYPEIWGGTDTDISPVHVTAASLFVSAVTVLRVVAMFELQARAGVGHAALKYFLYLLLFLPPSFQSALHHSTLAPGKSEARV